MIDTSGRTIDYLRISLTDRCNLRCVYCMPQSGIECMRHQDLLTYEEILRVVRLMARLGIRHVRVTGGEPMVRKGCLDFVRMLRHVDGVDYISMTTNGILLDGRMREARDAGLNAVNISIDTPDSVMFHRMTRGGEVNKVLRVVRDSLDLGLVTKLNAVPVRGMNDSALCELAALAQNDPLCVRFIELMPLGCGALLQPIPTNEVRSMLEARFGVMAPDDQQHGFGPAVYLKPEGFKGSIGFISPISHEFCDRCNRVRLTADGRLKLCLNHTAGLDLRGMIRNNISDDALFGAIRDAIAHKPERHGFHDEVEDAEARRMNQIGG